MQRILFLLLLVCLCAAPAWAHRVTLFAYPDGGDLVAEAGFPGGKTARNVNVFVLGADNEAQLAQGTTDEAGICRIPFNDAMRAAPGLKVVADVGDGHRAEWLVEAEEYGGAAAAGAPAETAESAEQAASAPQTATVADTAALRKELDAALEAKLGPIRRELAMMRESGPSLRDVAGGIGYLLGLAGLAAWMRYRKGSGA